MALKDVFGFFKDGLDARFATKTRDPAAARAPVLNGIDRALDQFREGRTRVPNKWWVANNGVVAFTPKVKGVPLVLNGGTTNHVAADDFPEFLAAFRQAVEAGELDAEIAAIERGDGNAGHSVTIPKTRRGGISPEAAKARGLKAAESRRRNREARAAGGE